MLDGLTTAIAAQGWLAPIWYIAGFLLAALVPVIPTPAIAALGGTVFGTVPAILYGLVGLALGTATSLTLARQLGRRLMRRIVPARAWGEWEAFLGIRSLTTWFLVFFTLNLDLSVMAAGLTSLPARRLWWTALAARVPWVVAAAWVGDLILVNDAALILVGLAMIPILWGVHRLRTWLRAFLARRVARSDAADRHPPIRRDTRRG